MTADKAPTRVPGRGRQTAAIAPLSAWVGAAPMKLSRDVLPSKLQHRDCRPEPTANRGTVHVSDRPTIATMRFFGRLLTVAAVPAAAAAVVTAAPAQADPTSTANQLHSYGIYGQRDYNAWLGKIACKRLDLRS